MIKKRPTIFLDRDGVLNVEKSYICKIEQLEIFPFVKECIQELHNSGYLAIVITNQSAVGRGMMTEEALLRINSYLSAQTRVDKIYYCPHWHDSVSNLTQYNIVCECRKPGIGLINKALCDFEIDLKNSYFIGDRDTDIITGKNCGIRTILVESGYDVRKFKDTVRPDYICRDLREAIQIILSGRNYNE